MTSIWKIERKDALLQGTGEPALLDAPLTAFFASRLCPGSAIRAAMDWALEQAHQRQGVVSGFHSPLEQSVLKVLLQAKSPVVAVLARPVADARLPPAWRAALALGHMAAVSVCDTSLRLTREQARERNEQAARLSDAIVIAHASAGGELARQSASWRDEGLAMHCLTPATP